MDKQTFFTLLELIDEVLFFTEFIATERSVPAPTHKMSLLSGLVFSSQELRYELGLYLEHVSQTVDSSVLEAAREKYSNLFEYLDPHI